MKAIQQFLNNLLSHQLAIGLVALNFTLLVIYTPPHYVFEMLQSMAIQILFGLCFLVVLFGVFRKWVGFGSVIIAITLLFHHLPIKQTSNYAAVSETDFSIAHFNVLKYNNNHADIISAALSSEATMLSFNEVTQNWAAALEKGLLQDYPFQFILPQNNSFGIALFSKTPISEPQVHWQHAIPFVSGYINVDYQSVFFVAAHTIPPTNKAAYYSRNEELRRIEKMLATHNGPKILVGDLNTVSWSEPLVAIKKNARMADSRIGLSPTYPSWNKFLRIPIDHILYSSEMTCTEFNAVWAEGSDHLGIQSHFIFKNPITRLD